MTLNQMPMIMARSLIFTILIETSVAFIIGLRKKDIINVILANIITNPIVVSVPVYMYIAYSLKYRNISLIILEILTVIVEGLIYKKFNKYKKMNPFLMSLLLNLASYGIGEILNRIL